MFGKSKRTLPSIEPVDVEGRREALAAFEQSNRDYVNAIHTAAQAEAVGGWLRRVRERNHIGPSFAAVYGRDR